MRTASLFSIVAATAVSVGLAGCNVPRGAGQAGSILRGADEENADFAVFKVERATVGKIAGWPGTGGGTPTAGWLPHKRGIGSNVIVAGDKVDLTIWETDDVSLLSVPGQKHVSMPQMTVSGDGTIFLPYVDKVYIGNMTPDEARYAIQAKLASVMPSAQVLIAHSPGRRQAVDLVSGVSKPGSFPMPDRDFTVLSLIALGGGIDADMTNPSVRLIRDGKLYGISAEKLMKDPSLDTTLRGGDKVYIEPESRHFIALGASGRQSQVPFPQDRVTALEALSLTGGLNVQRADAKAVLVLRDYPATAIRADGSGPPKDRVVFVIDLTTADGLFSAGEFVIQNRDVVVVAESPVNTTASVLGLIGSVVGVGRSVQAISNND